MAVSIDAVNQWGYEEFIDKLGGVVEYSSIVVAALWSHKPFYNLRHLHDKLCAIMDQLPFEVKQGILRVHPDLAGRLADQGSLTKESETEQKSAGLTTMAQDERNYLRTNNTAYKLKFGFPFVICARQNKKETIMREIKTRYLSNKEEETLKALDEVKKIALFRLKDIIQVDEQDFQGILSKI